MTPFQKKFGRKTFIHLDEPLPPVLARQEFEGLRFYQLPDGHWAPSITTVTGWAKREFFEEWRSNPDNARNAELAAERGDILHLAIENYLNNKDGYLDNAPNRVKGCFAKIKHDLNRINNIVAQEVPLHSVKFRIAGRVDCIAEWDGERAIIDFKGSNKEKREDWIQNYFHQIAGYALMWRELTGERIRKGVILVAPEIGNAQTFIFDPENYLESLVYDIKQFRADNAELIKRIESGELS